MKFIDLNFAGIKTREALHDYLSEQFQFPSYYGKNLDALWDLLMEISEETCLKLSNEICLSQALGQYADKLFIALHLASEENDAILIQSEEAKV